MGNNRGFTLTELVAILGVVGILSAVSIPPLHAAVQRNRLITGAELVAATVREARLAALTRNSAFRVRFDCPNAGAIRMLAVTGTAAIDDAADRCFQNQANDGPAVYMPEGVTFGAATPATLNVDGRGQMSLIGGGAMPATIAVSHGSTSRTFSITATGRITTPAY